MKLNKCELDVIYTVFATRKAWWFGPDGYDSALSKDGRSWRRRYSEDTPLTMLASGDNQCLCQALEDCRHGQV